MKKSLSHNDFDGFFDGGYSKRGVALSTVGYILETQWDKRIKRAKRFLFNALVVILLILSAMAFQKWLTWDIASEFTIKQIYQGNAKQVEQNKQKAMKEIAGAGSTNINRIKKQ